MKIFGLNSITIFLYLMVLFNLSNTPAVETGPAATAACILRCCGTACISAATVLKTIEVDPRVPGICDEIPFPQSKQCPPE